MAANNSATLPTVSSTHRHHRPVKMTNPSHKLKETGHALVSANHVHQPSSRTARSPHRPTLISSNPPNRLKEGGHGRSTSSNSHTSKSALSPHRSQNTTPSNLPSQPNKVVNPHVSSSRGTRPSTSQTISKQQIQTANVKGFKQMRRDVVKSTNSRLQVPQSHMTGRGQTRSHSHSPSSVKYTRKENDDVLLSKRTVSCDNLLKVNNTGRQSREPNKSLQTQIKTEPSNLNSSRKYSKSPHLINHIYSNTTETSAASVEYSNSPKITKEDEMQLFMLDGDEIWKRWPWQDERKRFVILLATFISVTLGLGILLICIFTAIYGR